MRGFIVKNVLRGAYVSVFLLILVQDAYAYLDPGTGSYLLQLLISAFLAIAFTVKMFWYKIKNFFGSPTSKKD